MFKSKNTQPIPASTAIPSERVTSVLGPGINWQGNLRGSGGVRIEGTFEGEIFVRGLVIVGETGRVTCEDLRANSVIVAGSVRGNITSEKLEIRSSGRVWGDVVTVAFATEEGAFLRGQVRMEERVELNLEPSTNPAQDNQPAANIIYNQDAENTDKTE
ncbi:MAG TPA: polymer-forming cytoskeletal protein [Anaerolineaceae bacterium]|nr:polymer-forming cytoskeletal protein [Anaerolineaceae bacterium]